MSTAPFDISELRHLLPEPLVGEVMSAAPIHAGLSGAGVYAVTSVRGDYILRIQSERASSDLWTQQLLVLRRAAERGIAPAIVHVDETARAVLSARVAGVPLPAVTDSAERTRAVADVVSRLRTLHTLDTSGVETRDPVEYARGAWNTQRGRTGFPVWGAGIGVTLDAIALVLARDPRRVVGHNDVNPGNVLWDGTRAWLVDWEVAGLAHPYYDVATLATFLSLDAPTAEGLLSLQEQAPLDDEARITFAALRQLVALVAGITFLRLASDLTVLSAATIHDAPTLGECFAAMRAGTLDLHSPSGSVMLGLALLRLGVASG
jgi:aminoglycoside phosphotransferase